MSSYVPLGYTTHYSELDLTARAGAVTTGMPSFGPPTPILPRYSSAGRMEPEFLDNNSDPGEDEGDKIPIIAQGRTTKILGYAPREGTYNTHIVVRLLFRRGRIAHKTQVSFRVKMGNIPLMTDIQGIESVRGVGGEWQLHVAAPDPVELDIVGLEVPLIVQALDVVTSTIIDDVCIGSFRYWRCASVGELHSSRLNRFNLESHTYDTEDHTGPRPPDLRPTSPVETDSAKWTDKASPYGRLHSLDDSATVSNHPDMDKSVSASSVRARARLTIEVPAYDTLAQSISKSISPDVTSPTVVRNPPKLSQRSAEDTYPASLNLRGDLNSMTQDWTPQEVQNNRRMVEFFCVQMRGCLNITFAPVSGEDTRNTRKTIVSCIWWDDLKEFVITSVDTIHLLERLVGTKFTTEEKNRIRRNLQGFKPATVSKNHPGSKSFFQTLMEFPAPRPRNIEKDVKAFWWSKLPNMLEKVISKYWFIASPGGSDSEDRNNAPNIRVVCDLDNASAELPDAVGPPSSVTHIPSSAQQSQPDGCSTHTGILPQSESDSFMTVPPPDDHDPIHAGSLENLNFHEIPSTTQNTSICGPIGSFMETNDHPMDELYSLQMENDATSGYHEPMEPYPEAIGALPPDSLYLHFVEGGDILENGLHDNMQFMAHTSHEYV